MNETTIIIVNWNTRDLLEKCLSSIGAWEDIIIIDNGSTDGSIEILKEKYGRARLISNQDNLGFGAACNQGIKQAKGKYLLFLNTDILINHADISRIKKFMDAGPSIGLCTGTLIKEGGGVQDTFGPYPSLVTEIFGRSIFRLINPSRYTPKKIKNTNPRQVESIRGACIMARKDAVEKAGGFSREYFLFFEETDLCKKIKKAGYSIWWLPDVRVTHLGGASAGKNRADARIEYWRSRYIFFRKHYSAWINVVLRGVLFTKLIADWLINLLGSIFSPCRKKPRIYTKIILWHLSGCPGDWGIGSGNITIAGNALVRNQFIDWWEKNKGNLLNCGKIIKDNSSRTVILYNNRAYIKKYKKGRAYRREWRLLLRLKQLGIATLTPIALGENYVVTEGLLDAENFHGYILENAGRLKYQQKISITKSFAEFTKKLHQKGLYHGDMHSGNVLIRHTGLGEPQFYITDLHRAELKLWLSRGQAAKNLVQMNIFFILHTSRQERLRFLKNYSGEGYRDLSRLIENKTKKAAKKLWKKRDRLYLKKSKYCVTKKTNCKKYLINPIYAGIDIDNLTQLKVRSIIKNSGSSYVYVSEISGIGGIVVKNYRQKTLYDHLKDIFRDSGAIKSWQGSWSLAVRGINVPVPLIAYQKRRFGVITESIFINSYIHPSENLTIWHKNEWGSAGLIYKKWFITKLSHFVRTIHDRGIIPGDLKGSNILVSGSGDNVDFYLTDLDHINIAARVGTKQAVRNFEQIRKYCPVTRAMQLRFLRGYYGIGGEKNAESVYRGHSS